MLSVQWIFAVVISNAIFINGQLYSKDDNVTIFQPKSFNETFNNIPAENWFIQFYHSYCGHCINFAPVFKQFLSESKYWSRVLRFGVVDCSQHKSTCSEQGVNYYPFFKMYLKKGLNMSSALGLKLSVPHDNIQHLFLSVITNIEVLLKPERLIESSLDRNITEEMHLLIIGGDKSRLKQAILTYTDRLLYPLLYRFEDKKVDYEVVFVNGTSSQSNSVKDLVGLYQWLSQYQNNSFDSKIYSPLEKVTNRPIFKPNINTSAIVPPVYNQDIYSSIYYSFTNDISDDVLTNIDKVIILRNFVEKLYLYSDISEQFTANFKKLLELLQKKIDGQRYRAKFVMMWPDMLRLSKFPEIEPSWIGCNGSEPHLRRYPCGLWTMLHTLTVNHHIKVTSKEVAKDDSLGLMQAVREFIFTFFSCRECAENFKNETAAFEAQASDSGKAVIFMWRVHNSVNKRLAKAPSEDPRFPKIAFPSPQACPACRLNKDLEWPRFGQWSYPDLLTFLVLHYSNLNRVQFLTQPVLLLRTTSWFRVGPSSLDISICLILSAFCLFIAVLAFVKFWIKTSFCPLKKYRRSTPLL